MLTPFICAAIITACLILGMIYLIETGGVKLHRAVSELYYFVRSWCGPRMSAEQIAALTYQQRKQNLERRADGIVRQAHVMIQSAARKGEVSVCVQHDDSSVINCAARRLKSHYPEFTVDAHSSRVFIDWSQLYTRQAVADDLTA